MAILIRLALNCGLFCLLLQAIFPGLNNLLPGNGNAFDETAFFVLIAVVAREFWICFISYRSGKDSDERDDPKD